jgi:hypothetical protein
MDNLTAYLQFGGATFGGGPMLTLGVPVKESLLPWQERGLSYTATGYGSKIPTSYMVKHLGRWRRVYCCIYSNSGTLFLSNGKEWLCTVDIQTT